PDAEPAVADHDWAAPVVRDLDRGGDEKLDPTGDTPRREPPQRDLVDERAVSPAPARDQDRRRHREHVREPVGVEEEGTEVQPVRRRTRNETSLDHALRSLGSTS